MRIKTKVSEVFRFFYDVPILSDSLADIGDETLQSELEKRGYNITRRRTDKTTTEIVKIG